MTKKKAERYWGRIEVLGEIKTFSVESTDVMGATSKLLTIYRKGYKILSIEKNGLNYPELTGIEISPKADKVKPLESELLPGLEEAFGRVKR